MVKRNKYNEVIEEVDLDELERENEAIIVLTDAEAVLIKRIAAMRDGKPKDAAKTRVREIQKVLKFLKANPTF